MVRCSISGASVLEKTRFSPVFEENKLQLLFTLSPVLGQGLFANDIEILH